MENYRPKSLDEVGDMFGKSMEADQEIKKGSSKLDTVKAPVSDAFSEETTAEPGRITPEQKAADEIASKVGDFAKSFGSAGTGRAPANIATVQSRPRVPKKKPEAPVASEGKGKRVPVSVQKDPKSRLIRNSERTDLFDSYKSVMNDEDDSASDGEESRKRSSKKRRAEKKSKASSGKVAEAEKIDVSGQAQAAVAAVFGDSIKDEDTSVTVSPKNEATVHTETVNDPFEAAEEREDRDTEAKNVANPVARIALTAVLLLVLLLSVLIGSIKAFTKLNSDAVAFGDCQLYSAETNYPGTSIGKGDLVFVENRQPSQGETIAYREPSGRYGFVTFEAALNSECMTVSGNSDKLVVVINEYRGAVIKTVPVIGGVFAVFDAYFLPIMALMFLLIGILILLIFFTSKGKAESDDDADETEEEEEATESSPKDAFDAFAETPFDEYTPEEKAVRNEAPVQQEEPQDDEDEGDWYYIPDDAGEVSDGDDNP